MEFTFAFQRKFTKLTNRGEKRWPSVTSELRFQPASALCLIGPVKTQTRQMWEEKGGASYSPNVAYLACWGGGGGAGVEQGFLPCFPPLNPRYVLWSSVSCSPKNTVLYCLLLWCLLIGQSKEEKQCMPFSLTQFSHKGTSSKDHAPMLLKVRAWRHCHLCFVTNTNNTGFSMIAVALNFPNTPAII